MPNLRFALAVALAALPACSGDPVEPGPPDGAPPVVTPTALARCAAPDGTIEAAWEVDNVRDPLVAQAQLGATILLASEDGAVKSWLLDGEGTPSDPAYGTPFAEEGFAVTALAAAPAGGMPAFVGLDSYGQAKLWSENGFEIRPALAMVSAPGAYVAVDDQLRWIAGGTADHGGALTIADVATGAITGPLETPMWNITDAEFGHGTSRLVTVGHMYGCPAIEVRDASEPAAVLGYWDGCLNGGMFSGWLRAVAVSPDATQAIAVGDGLILRFDLADVAAGPVDVEQTYTQLDAIEWSAADAVAITLGPDPATGGSTITVWSTGDLAIARRASIPGAIGLTALPAAGLLVTARADGMVRADRCME
jgi:hypothetical protein